MRKNPKIEYVKRIYCKYCKNVTLHSLLQGKYVCTVCRHAND